MSTPVLFTEAWIADLKSRASLTSLLVNGGAEEIREAEWQGTDFQYPNIRVSLDFMPPIEGCGPIDADVYLEVFSAEKSSKQATIIASKIVELYHKRPFISNTIHFSTVAVRKVEKPNRSIYAWVSTVHIFCQGI